MIKFCVICLGLGWDEHGDNCSVCHGSGELYGVCYACSKLDDDQSCCDECLLNHPSQEID